jgi:hypothetical protein
MEACRGAQASRRRLIALGMVRYLDLDGLNDRSGLLAAAELMIEGAR